MIFNTISDQEYSSILSKSYLSDQDRFKLQSYTCYSLVNCADYSDMSTSEKIEVARLEEKNLYKVINAASILAGVFGADLKQKFLGLSTCRSIIQEVESNKSLTKRDKDRLTYSILLRHALTNFSQSPNANPVFDGKVPQKLFKFRQMTAEEWYKKIVQHICFVAGYIYADQGLEKALAFITGYIAHYLNKSQPSRYFIPATSRDENEAVYEIVGRFVDNVSGDHKVLDFTSNVQTML